MKLTKKSIKQLQNILYNIERAESLIYNENYLVCTKTSSEVSTVYKNKKGDKIDSINKYIGSDLVGIYDAKKQLKNFITFNS